MEAQNDDLRGMSAGDAREYIAAHIATLHLTERRRDELEAELATWSKRQQLALAKGAADLAEAAGRELDRRGAERDRLAAEALALRQSIEKMKSQVSGLAARERAVDPDLLEQELLMAAGRLPGDEQKAAAERTLAELEKEAGADAALAALKERMRGQKPS